MESNYLKDKTSHISIFMASSHDPLIGCDSTLNRNTVELVLVYLSLDKLAYILSLKKECSEVRLVALF